jgi:hypothetical protein
LAEPVSLAEVLFYGRRDLWLLWLDGVVGRYRRHMVFREKRRALALPATDIIKHYMMDFRNS